MPRKASPYKKGDYFCTSAGGIPHQKLCPVGDGKLQAERALARLLVQQDDIRLGRVDSPTKIKDYPNVPEALDNFMSNQKSETSPATYDWYLEKLLPLYERFADKKVCEVTHKDGTDYKTWLRQEREWVRGKTPRKGLSATTVNHHLRAARVFFVWCAKMSRRHVYGVMTNPWAEIGFMDEKPRERVITQEEFEHLLEQCTSGGGVRYCGEDMREQLLVLRNTTMRPQEMRLLKWDYVHWNEHRLVFPATVIKTRKRREVTMIDVAERVLLERKKRMEAAGLRLAGRYVFPLPGLVAGTMTAGMGDQLISASTLSKRFGRLISKCVNKGLIEKEKSGERLCAYSTRHTRITELVSLGHSQAVVMMEAGHTNPNTTARYTHLGSAFIADQIRAKEPKKDI